MLGHAISYARSLGMSADMILGTGWPYGGPSVSPEFAARKLLGLPTGMRVKRPALGGEGPVLDHLNPRAVAMFLDDTGPQVMAAAGPAGLRAIHLDSLEVYGKNWTPDFPEAFAQRRGYDLMPLLAALERGSKDPLARDVRFDFWHTLSELGHERFIRPLHEWCRRHGVALQAESYGTPPVDMASYADVDDPAGESYDWKNFVASRWASSAAHQFGKRTTAVQHRDLERTPVSSREPISSSGFIALRTVPSGMPNRIASESVLCSALPSRNLSIITLGSPEWPFQAGHCLKSRLASLARRQPTQEPVPNKSLHGAGTGVVSACRHRGEGKVCACLCSGPVTSPREIQRC